jgi:hypothetical protein
MHEKEQDEQNKENEMRKFARISKGLAQWISGSKHEQFQIHLDGIIEDAGGSIKTLQNMETYVVKQVRNVCENQTSAIKHALNSGNGLKELQELFENRGNKE